MNSDTIAAIATPLGEGGIGVVRISGESAKQIADKCFNSVSGKRIGDAKGYSALYGHILADGKVVDEAVALVFNSPKSYTGENTVEFSVHGGSYVVKAVLRAVINCGARLAEPGEFTKRAFLNGKLDLSQAESVMGIISAGGEQSLKASISARDGAVSQKISEIKSTLLDAAARIAAFSDYPDEEPEFSGIDKLSGLINSASENLVNLIKNYDAGKVLQSGINTVIVGRPNVGKSTLMNLLTGSERSIVTSVAGTTRDVVEETVMLGEIKLRLADTAGVHSTDDEVEKIGVERALNRVKSAELALAVFDCSQEFTDEDKDLFNLVKNISTIAVLNKSDLKSVIDESYFEQNNIPVVTISAKSAAGIEELKSAVEKIVGLNNLSPNAVVFSSERQRACAVKAKNSLDDALTAMQSGFTIDAVGVCLDDALAVLMELTGERVTTAVANEVFKRFCVGK